MKNIYKNPVAELVTLDCGDIMRMSKLLLNESDAKDIEWSINADSWL